MARGMVPIKGSVGTSVRPKNVPQHPSFVLGSRPGVLRAPPIERPPMIKPQAAGTRNYGKQSAAPFSTLGSGDTGMGENM